MYMFSLVAHSICYYSPLIGGSLAKPAERFPKLFGDSDFLKTYPYFLPCAVPATFSLVAWLVTFLFLKEVCLLLYAMKIRDLMHLIRPFRLRSQYLNV